MAADKATPGLPMRETTHLIALTKRGQWHIISTLSSREDTQLVSIDQRTGHLEYSAINGIGLFPNESAALEYLTEQMQEHDCFVKKCRACAIIGYVPMKTRACLLVATKTEACAFLPGGHIVHTIIESQWIQMTLTDFGLSATQIQNTGTQKWEEALKEFPVEGFHYYCESYDITRPYPSKHAVYDYDKEFVWNEWLASPFTASHMREWCVVLLQGRATSRAVELSDLETGKPATANISFIVRKSNLNPGTRYKARGINERAGTGNEIDAQEVMWRTDADTADGGAINFATFALRRGTVPLWWHVVLNSSMSQPEIHIRENNTYEGSDVYFTRLVERYGDIPITCLNLLRVGPEAKETALSEHFQKCVRLVRENAHIQTSVVNFDWHHLHKVLGKDMLVQALWSLVTPFLEQMGVGIGVAKEGEVTMSETQKGLVRFNCADSLDRTNLAAFFVCMQVTGEMSRRLGVGLMPGSSHAQPYPRWSMIKCPLEEVRENLHQNMISSLAEIFIEVGDACSLMYTNTNALFSAMLREFVPQADKARHNTLLSLQRRLSNVFQDDVRHLQYHMFLGLKRTHLGSDSNSHFNLRCVSRFPRAYAVQEVPGLLDRITPDALLQGGSMFPWTGKQGQQVVELYVYLGEPCCVTDIGITIRHSRSDVTSPRVMDVYLGKHAKDMQVVKQGLVLPRTSDNTTLFYNLTGRPWGEKSESPLYNYRGETASTANMYGRFVKFVFRGIPEGGYMTLGNVEVFGFVPQVDGSVPVVTPKISKRLSRISLGSLPTPTSPLVEETNVDLMNSSGASDTSKPQELIRASSDLPDMAAARRDRLGSAISSCSGSESAPEDNMSSPKSKVVEKAASGSALFTALQTTMEEQDSEAVGGNKDAASAPDTPSEEGVSGNQDYSSSSESEDESGESPVVVDASDVGEAMEEVTPQPLPDDVHEPAKLVRRMSGGVPSATHPQEIEYIQLVMNKLRTRYSSLTFLDTLEMEYFRLFNNISAEKRDMLLRGLGRQNLREFDPNRFVRYRDEKIEKNLRHSAKYKSSHCSCGASMGARQKSCRYCRMRCCQRCIGEHQEKIVEFAWEKPQRVCNNCYDIIVRQTALIRDIGVLLRAQLLSKAAVDVPPELIQVQHRYHPRFSDKWASESVEVVNLAEYPAAGILLPVKTHEKSPPVESLLLPPGEGNDALCWWSPDGVTEAGIIIVLGFEGMVSKIVIQADDRGYTESDVPTIKIGTSRRIPKFASKGQWSLLRSAPEGGTNGKCINPRQSVEYRFETPVRCRFLSLHFSLPKWKGAVEGAEARHIHVGGIQVMGIASPSPVPMALTPAEEIETATVLDEIPVNERSVIRPNWTNYRSSKKILDIGIAIQYVHGFRIEVGNRRSGGHILKVVVSQTDNLGRIVGASRLTAEYHVPMVASQSRLHYDFPVPLNGNVITFEAEETLQYVPQVY